MILLQQEVLPLFMGNFTENFNINKSDILILCVIDLPDLGGSELIKNQGYNIQTLVAY